MIRMADERDAQAICDIYNHYIQHTVITFEEVCVSREVMAQRIRDTRAGYPWYVLEEEGCITGYCYATRWRERSAYRNTAEITVYLDANRCGQRRGTRLYACLIDNLKELGLHTLVAGIALPNEASVAIHEKFGFEKVAHFKEVGWKFEQWIDVGYWQLHL